MTVLGALASRREVSNSILTPWGDWSESGSMTSAGVSVSVDNAAQLLTVYGCTRFIADGIATLPIDVFSGSGDAPVEVTKPRWLVEPTPDLDFVGWCGQVISSLLLAGNAYVLKGYTGTSLTSLTPLNPTSVRVRRKNGRKVYDVNDRELTGFDVLHISGLMWAGDDVGLSPVESARQMIGLGMSMEDFAAQFFGQGATLSGVIEVPGDLDPGQARTMARQWGQKHGGSNKAHLPGVLQGGAQWKPMGVTNEQAQFLESRKFTAGQIAAEMFLIDPNEMGLPVDGTSLTYSNEVDRNKRKVEVTFLPWIVRIENAISSLLAKPRFVKFNTSALLRGDTTTRYDAYAVGIANGFMLPNEARAFENWQPLDEPPPLPPQEPPV